MSTKKIKITEAAIEIIDELKDRFGDLMFHQSGGCCDGSSPMCFEKGDFKTGESDVFLQEIYGCEFYMSKDQYQYWKYSQLTLDVVPGRGSSFSLEIPMGIRFVIKSRLFKSEELQELELV